MEKSSQIEHLIINPMEILSLIEENFDIKFSRSILDFQYNIATFVFGIRFYQSKSGVSDLLDNDGLIVVNRDKETNQIASIEILDLNAFFDIYS
jgi:hypothetical protein